MSNKKLSVKEMNGFQNLLQDGNFIPCSFTPNIPTQGDFGSINFMPTKYCTTQCLHATYNSETKEYEVKCGVGIKFTDVKDFEPNKPTFKIIGSND